MSVMSIHKSTLRLFKALPVMDNKTVGISPTFLKRTIPKGYVVDPKVAYHYKSIHELEELIEEIYGMTAESMNATFHKSWQKIVDTPQEELFIQAMAHYCTTYGKADPLGYLREKREMFGLEGTDRGVIELPDFDANKMFDEDYIYFPNELLEIPSLEGEKVKLVIIKGMTKEELKKRLLDLLATGIALGEDSVKDCVEIAKFVDLKAHEAVMIKNKEVKVAVYDYLQFVPEDPVEFLRYVVFKATGQTLLIKNGGLIARIKEGASASAGLFSRYVLNYGTPKLAEIFYRFKPILLAFKTDTKIRPIINKIRRLAPKYHKPMTPDFLNNVTANLRKWGVDGVEYRDLELALKQVNTFRKIRLAYALKYRAKWDNDSILYRIRNGKSYAKEFCFPNPEDAGMVLDVVLESITSDIAKNVGGKRIYIPDYINYTLPATEKMFTGNFPSGTSVSVDRDIIFGINWHNCPEHRVDLDLSLIEENGNKIGWDRNYSSENKNILFSGDITDAKGKNGATELFYISEPMSKSGLMYVNYYNHDDRYPVDFKIVVARAMGRREWKKNYVINPNEMIALSNSKIDQKQKVLGLIVSKKGKNTFYFAESYMGRSITSGSSEWSDQARKYLLNYYENAISLRDVLEKAGANVVSEKFAEEKYGEKECIVEPVIDIDLSPEQLGKDTIIRLLS